tara:strand:+ start:1629 stop:2486 length:858 start_codon:yes stop_codon:yes gene_type:complete
MNIKITLLLILALFSVSTSPIIGRGLENVGAISISFWRMFLASFFLWIFSACKSQGKINITKNRNKIICAGVLLGFHFALFFEAIKITSISNATFLGTLAPFFTLILEIYFLKRKFSRTVLIGLIITFLGSLIILVYNFDLSTSFTLGNIYAILCSICLAIAFIIAEKVRENENTIVYTRTLYLSAAITLFFISFFANKTLIISNYSDFFWLLFLGLVPTIVGHNSIYYAIKYVSPTIVAAFPLGEPIIATLLAYLIFNELITVNIYLGGALTLIGLILISQYKK